MSMFKHFFRAAAIMAVVLPAAAQQSTSAFGQQQQPQPSPSPAPLVGNTPIPVTGATIPPNTATTGAAPPIPSAQYRQVEREVDESVFGSNLFLGRFAEESFRAFNPDYVVSPGDLIDLKLWGAFDLVMRLEVDSQGNIFVPKVGPVKVGSTRNANLNEVLRQRIKDVFRENVGVYAALVSAEPVKVFVSGEVRAPGLYGAYASDSLLHFIDRAGGIDTDTGSFLDIRVRRGSRTLARINLYDFLRNGDLPLMQFRDGDTIVVGPRKSTAEVSGLVKHEAQFEFDERIRLSALLNLAGVDERATHVQVVRNQTPVRESDYLPLSADLESIWIVSGDQVSVFADRQIGTIIAQVEGEYQGLSQYVLPYEANLSDLIGKVEATPRSNMDGLQLYRVSIAERQRQVLEEMLQKLEQSVLTARSGTREEAELRTREAELVLQFIERAREVEPKGRLVLHQGFDPNLIDLQDQDVLRIPRLTHTVAVQGEVFFPSSFVWQEDKNVEYYLEQAGGLTQRGDRNRVFVIRPSGEMVEAKGGWGRRVKVQAGDEIMVLPQVDRKTFQFSKDLIQIIYQLALSAGVVLRL